MKNEVSGVNFNQINMTLALKYFKKYIKCQECFLFQTPRLYHLYGELSRISQVLGVVGVVVNDSEKQCPQISNSISDSPAAPGRS